MGGEARGTDPEPGKSHRDTVERGPQEAASAHRPVGFPTGLEGRTFVHSIREGETVELSQLTEKVQLIKSILGMRVSDDPFLEQVALKTLDRVGEMWMREN